MLITPPYLLQQAKMHKAPRGYGGGGYKWAKRVYGLARLHCCTSLLDYGCGQGTLVEHLKGIDDATLIKKYYEYDPAIADKAAAPRGKYDLVTCTDVLEHVEPECLNAVLGHLKHLTGKLGFFVIALRPSNKDLPDGRNAHLILEDREWWFGQLKTFWQHVLIEQNLVKKELIVQVTP